MDINPFNPINPVRRSTIYRNLRFLSSLERINKKKRLLSGLRSLCVGTRIKSKWFTRQVRKDDALRKLGLFIFRSVVHRPEEGCHFFYLVPSYGHSLVIRRYRKKHLLPVNGICFFRQLHGICVWGGEMETRPKNHVFLQLGLIDTWSDIFEIPFHEIPLFISSPWYIDTQRDIFLTMHIFLRPIGIYWYVKWYLWNTISRNSTFHFILITLLLF